MKLETVMLIENYRGAVYFSTISNLRRFFKMFLFFFAFAIIYLVLGQLGVIPYFQIINFIVTAYLVFTLFQFGRIELAIYRYAKREDTLIGLDIIYNFYTKYFTVEIPSKQEKSNYSLDTVMEVVEMSSNFMIYMSASQIFIIPKNGMDENKLSEVRTYFITNLKGRFSSTVLNKANKSMKLPGKNLSGK